MGAKNDYRAEIYGKYDSGFKKLGQSFDRAAAARLMRPLRFRFRGWLPSDRHAEIADVGCGSGALLHYFSTLGYSRLSGVDISAEQVAIANQLGVTAVQGDALSFLRRNAGKFDLLTSVDVIEHLTKPEGMEFLRACHAAIKPGGRLILQMPNGAAPWFGPTFFSDFTHETCYTPRLMADLLRLVGFVQPTSREVGPVPWGAGAVAALRYPLW